MYTLPTVCPVCQDGLLVTRLVCRSCGTALEGRFALGRLFELTADQRDFVEMFVRCEGKISRVQEELNLSYPTVRSRLEEVIQALGYDVDQKPAGVVVERRQEILERLARQEMSSEEALRLMREQ